MPELKLSLAQDHEATGFATFLRMKVVRRPGLNELCVCVHEVKNMLSILRVEVSSQVICRKWIRRKVRSSSRGAGLAGVHCGSQL